jgi:lysophospholipase L1-like esterase
MMRSVKFKISFVLFALLFLTTAWTFIKKDKPTIYIIGDSTVKNGKGIGDDGLFGWGDMLQSYFDTSKIVIKNYARGGRSSRTFQSEGLWDSVMARLKPGDYVFMQFGHNDGSSPNTGRARGTLKGVGDDTIHVIMEATGKDQVIQSYGWYMRKYIRDAKSKEAYSVVFSPVPRNIWKDGKVERASGSYGKWASQVAKEEGAFFVDLNEITALKYEKMAPDSVKAWYFPGDHTHTSKAGAIVNAESVMEGLKAIKDCKLNNYLRKK